MKQTLDDNSQKHHIFKNIHLAQEIAKENNKAAQLQMKTIYDRNISAVTFQVGEQVLLRDKMKQKGKNSKFLPKYRGPCVLIKQLSPVTFQIKTNNNKMWDKFHIRRLKKYNSLDKRIIQPPDLSTALQPNDQSLVTDIISSGNDPSHVSGVPSN